MTGAWFAVELAAVAAGFAVAVAVIRRWLILPARYTPAERLYVTGHAGRNFALIAVVCLAAGLTAMWSAPYSAAVCFAVSSAGFTLAGWITGQRRVRGSGGGP